MKSKNKNFTKSVLSKHSHENIWNFITKEFWNNIWIYSLIRIIKKLFTLKYPPDSADWHKSSPAPFVSLHPQLTTWNPSSRCLHGDYPFSPECSGFPGCSYNCRRGDWSPECSGTAGNSGPQTSSSVETAPPSINSEWPPSVESSCAAPHHIVYAAYKTSK